MYVCCRAEFFGLVLRRMSRGSSFLWSLVESFFLHSHGRFGFVIGERIDEVEGFFFSSFWDTRRKCVCRANGTVGRRW